MKYIGDYTCAITHVDIYSGIQLYHADYLNKLVIFTDNACNRDHYFIYRCIVVGKHRPTILAYWRTGQVIIVRHACQVQQKNNKKFDNSLDVLNTTSLSVAKLIERLVPSFSTACFDLFLQYLLWLIPTIFHTVMTGTVKYKNTIWRQCVLFISLFNILSLQTA